MNRYAKRTVFGSYLFCSLFYNTCLHLKAVIFFVVFIIFLWLVATLKHSPWETRQCSACSVWISPGGNFPSTLLPSQGIWQCFLFPPPGICQLLWQMLMPGGFRGGGGGGGNCWSRLMHKTVTGKLSFECPIWLENLVINTPVVSQLVILFLIAN